ncbi:probable membrane-associated kinase regulator 4 [Miscanthus floridulus]|uniref:probable membrane-associated kinase regulator 4 n=1 Tax=Miscanthus floridulus TaxID=154761 RepID=UPI00345ACB85
MCPRATAQHCGDAMASVCSFVEEEYIDLDLSSCGEFEFQVRRSGAADELLCRGRLQPPQPPAAAPHKAAPPRPGRKAQEVDVGVGGGAGRRSAATVAPLQHSHSAGCRDDDTQPVARLRTECSRRRKAARTVHAKLLASRAFFRSLFARTSCSDEQCRGADVRASTRAAAAPLGETKSTACKAAFGQIKNGYGYHSGSGKAAPTTLRSSIEQEKLMDEEELAAAAAAAARQRKSFSGVIKWRHAMATAAAAPPAAAPAKPLSSSSARRSSGVGGGPALKRSSSARSESEGLIQGAIAYCKRSQQQLGLARKSVSDAALCSASAPSSWPSNPARSAVVAYCH